MKILVLVSVYLIFCLCGCKGQEQGEVVVSGSKLPALLDSFLINETKAAFNKAKAPGILLAVSYNTGRNYYTTGFANTETKMAFDSSMLFEIGSITKTFTAYILMNVLSERNISDSSSIINYLPDSVKQNRALRKISFLKLINHSSGLLRLPDDIFIVSPNSLQPYENYKKENLFAYLKRCIPEPDSTSHYSNLGFGVAGVLAELISVKSYMQLLKEYIIDPFGMANTGTALSQHNNIANGVFGNTKAEYWKMDAFAGAGVLKSTAADILIYLERMSNPQSVNSRHIVDKLTTPTITLSPQMKICRGWHTIEDPGKPVIYWHNGGTYGFSTFAAFTKNDNKSVVVVINAFNKNGVSDALGISIIKKMLQ